MSAKKETSVFWGYFGPKSTSDAHSSALNSGPRITPLGRFEMIRRLFGLRKLIDARDMQRAVQEAATLKKCGCSSNAPVLTAVLAEMSAEIEVYFGRYDAAESLLRDVVIPGYQSMPDCVSKRARLSLQAFYCIRGHSSKFS